MAAAHLHMLVHARWQPDANHLRPEVMSDWLTRLVEALGMNMLFKPMLVMSDNPGNEGLTGIVGLDTSHISFHDWGMHNPAYFQMDVYTCGELIPEVVIGALRDFEFGEINWTIIDRDAGKFKVLEAGTDLP